MSAYASPSWPAQPPARPPAAPTAVDCALTPVRGRREPDSKLGPPPFSLQDDGELVDDLHHPETYGLDCAEWIADLGPSGFDTSMNTFFEAEDPGLDSLPDLEPRHEEGLLSLCDPVNLLLAAKCDELEARGDQLFKALYEGCLPVNGLCNVRCSKTLRLCSHDKDHFKTALQMHSWAGVLVTEDRGSRKRSRAARHLDGFPFC